MAYIQRTTPPPNRIMSFTLKNFTGGLNNRSEILEPNQASDLLNMAFANDTIMEKRKGTEYYNEFVTNEPIIRLDEFKPYQSDDQLLVATRSFLYRDNEVLQSLSSGMQGVNYNGRYYFVDGEHIYVYGKFSQEESTYTRVLGDPIDEYIVMKLVNPSDGFTQLGEEHTRGVNVVNYTDKIVCYEPCKLEMEDALKGANVLPEKPKYITVHHGRLFISGAEKDNDNVFISDVRNGYYFPVALPMQLPPNSDKVRGLIVYDDAVVVGRKYDVYSITGMTNNAELGFPIFRLRKVNTHAGFMNQDSVQIVHNYLFYLGSDGNVYSLSSARNDEKVLSTSVISRTLDFEKHPINLTREDLYTATSYFHDDHFYLSIKDKVLLYSYRNQAWTMYNNLDARSFYHINDKLLWGTEHGHLVHHSEEYLDLGFPYRAFWMSKNFDMDDANAFKQFRDFYIVAHTYNDRESEVRMTFEVDYVDVKENVGLNDMISIYGRAKFGDRFITRNIHASHPFTIGRRGRTIRFRFANGYFIQDEAESVDHLYDMLGKRENLLVRITGEDCLMSVVDENCYYLYRKGEWIRMEEKDLNQPMKVYQVNGEYEIRGKR